MTKIKAYKVTLIEATNSPHIENGKRTCYDKDDLDIIKKQTNFDCLSYYKIKKIDDQTTEENLICILGINSNGDPLIGIHDYAALPCPPYCDDDPLPNDKLKGTCVKEADIHVC